MPRPGGTPPFQQDFGGHHVATEVERLDRALVGLGHGAIHAAEAGFRPLGVEDPRARSGTHVPRRTQVRKQPAFHRTPPHHPLEAAVGAEELETAAQVVVHG